MSRRALRRVGFVLVWIGLSHAGVSAKHHGVEIEPGPSALTPEERAIAPDPDAGVTDGVILVEETDRNEDRGTGVETVYHLRAKILSNEGRSLADVEIPVDVERGKLKRWWGRTLLPDGTVLELPKGKLERQSVMRFGGREIVRLRAALRGVVPGCVIDYGYDVLADGPILYDRIELQRAWPIRRLLFSWKPSPYVQSAYRLVAADDLDVKASLEKSTIVLTGKNLPPFVEEPMMPPAPSVRGALVVYYLPLFMDFDAFWEQTGFKVEVFFSAHFGKKHSVNRAIEEMGLESVRGGLDAKLRAAYAWLGSHVTRSDLRTFEQLQNLSDDEDKGRDLVGKVLDERAGDDMDVKGTFLAVARQLGAEAHLVLVADRTENLFDFEQRTMWQFGGVVVAVGPEGTSDDRLTFVDPGSGLDYGEIPWRFTGAHGLLIAKSGARPVALSFGRHTESVADTRVVLSFSQGNASLLSDWTRTGSGQVGYDERRELRRLSPQERERRVDTLCGARSDVEVAAARMDGVDDLTVPFALHCNTERLDVVVDEGLDRYELRWDGPWLREVPDLPEGDRHYPVVLDYAYTERAHIDVAAPAGFEPGPAPAPIRIGNSFARYTLRFSRTDVGFTVDRELIMGSPVVPKGRYGELREFLASVTRSDHTPLPFTGVRP